MLVWGGLSQVAKNKSRVYSPRSATAIIDNITCKLLQVLITGNKKNMARIICFMLCLTLRYTNQNQFTTKRFPISKSMYPKLTRSYTVERASSVSRDFGAGFIVKVYSVTFVHYMQRNGEWRNSPTRFWRVLRWAGNTLTLSFNDLRRRNSMNYGLYSILY